MPEQSPLEEALSALSERFVTIRLTREDWRRELSPVIEAAKAEAVEPHISPLPPVIGKHDYCARCAAEARHTLTTPAGG